MLKKLRKFIYHIQMVLNWYERTNEPPVAFKISEKERKVLKAKGY